MVRNTVLVLLMLWAAAPAAAASFDCGKARTPDEIAVCRDPALSELDATMGALFFAYDKVPMLMGSNGARRDDAQQFLTARAACGVDKACLRGLYQRRIAGLRSDIAAAMQVMLQLQNGQAPSARAPGDLPDGVAKLVAAYPGQCRAIGGRPAGGSVKLLSGDIDGDGRPDYVVDPGQLRCDGAATAYCGNAGCAIDVALSSTAYAAPVQVLGGEASLTQRGDVAVFALAVDATNCNVPKYEKACRATYAWRDGALTATYQVRPLER